MPSAPMTEAAERSAYAFKSWLLHKLLKPVYSIPIALGAAGGLTGAAAAYSRGKEVGPSAGYGALGGLTGGALLRYGMGRTKVFSPITNMLKAIAHENIPDIFAHLPKFTEAMIVDDARRGPITALLQDTSLGYTIPAGGLGALGTAAALYPEEAREVPRQLEEYAKSYV